MQVSREGLTTDIRSYTPFPRVRFDGGSNQNVTDRGFVSTGPDYI